MMIIKRNIIRIGMILLPVVLTGSYVQGQVKMPSPASLTPPAKATPVNVRGTVLDSRSGLPVRGARVTYGKSIARLTDSAGAFALELPDRNALIEVSMDGYTAKQVPVLAGKECRITLYPDDYHSFYEKTTTVFGDNGILSTTGAVEKQDWNAWEQNSETADSYLQGKFAGVSVTRKSGTPSIGANVLIRNFSSLYTNNQPLYIVDGVVYNAEMHSPSITTGHGNNALQNIDIRDVQDVTILKDAIAASIYGARAANGVIVINTNHTKELATKIDLQLSTGVNTVPGRLPLLDAYNYRSYLNDVLATTAYTGAEIAAMPFNNDSRSFAEYAAYHNNTDWQGKVLKGSMDKNLFLRVTGGDDIAKYALSVGYNNERGIIDNTQQDKYTARFNGDMKLTEKFTAQTNISLGYGQQRLKDQGLSPLTNPLFLGLVKSPLLHPNELSGDGKVSPNYAAADIFGYSNPMQLIYNGLNNKKAYRFLGSVVFDYKLNDRFNLSNLTAVTYDKAQEDFFVPKKGVATDTINNMEVSSRLGAQVARYYSISNDLRLGYNRNLGHESTIRAMAGLRYHRHDAEQDYAVGFNSATDQLVTIGNSTASSRVYGGQIGKWVNLTGYALANLTLNNKYLVSGSVGVDGSSRFGDKVDKGLRVSGNTYGVFPAAGLGWILSNEAFLKGSTVLNLFKLRVSYGLTGNDDIGNYSARQNYVSQNFLGVQGLVREGASNPWLQWETVVKANAGVDLSFFQERLNISVDIYQNTTKNMLVYNRGNTVSGISYYLYNNGEMKNTGLDLSIFGRVLDRRIKWDAGLTLGMYKNKITAVPETIFTEFAGATYITEKGAPANAFYGFRYEGVYATQAEAAAAGLGVLDIAGNKIPFEAGDAKFKDKNNDGIIDNNDRYVLGAPIPDLFGGMNHTLNYKKWSLNALLTFSAGNEVYNYTRAQLESGKTYYNQTELMQNRWKAEGQVTNVPKVAYGDPMGNARFSDRWIEDGSYLRLRQLSLEYDMNVNRQLVKYIRIYGTANNLLTFSRYLGYDPEFAMSGDVFHQGVDVTLEPIFRSYQIGVRLGL